MDIFSKNLDLGKQAHLFWDFNVRDVGACVLVSRRPCVQMLMFDVVQQIQFIEKRGALQVKACESRPWTPPASHEALKEDVRKPVAGRPRACRDVRCEVRRQGGCLP